VKRTYSPTVKLPPLSSDGRAPALLRAFIRFCHAERGIRPVLTDQTLAAVDEYEPEYQRVIRSPRPQGPMALPDEEFGWDGVPAHVRDRVGEVLAACDRCCDDLFGPEYRTACRRLLARAGPGMPGMLRKTTKPEAIAAGLCWVIGQGNHRFGRTDGELRVKDVTSHLSLGQSGISERGYQIMRAAGIKAASACPEVRLGSPDLLVSARRKRIIELRDRHRGAIGTLR
jgi:hypothetical protein